MNKRNFMPSTLEKLFKGLKLVLKYIIFCIIVQKNANCYVLTQNIEWAFVLNLFCLLYQIANGSTKGYVLFLRLDKTITKLFS